MAKVEVACSITEPPCGKPAMGRGWCSMHYATWKKYGDPVHPEAEAKRRQKQALECSYEGCHEKPKGRGYCGVHLRRVVKHGEATDPRERRFWAQVDRRGPDECWPWDGYLQWNGYGIYGAGKDGTTRLAHRIAYEYVNGPIPEGLVLDHECHTRDRSCKLVYDCPHRRCCNPRHGRPKTQAQNIASGNGGGFLAAYVPPPPKPEAAAKPAACAEDDGRCGEKIYRRDLCVKHYKRWQRDPARERAAARSPEERFWEKVDKDGSVPERKSELGPCWPWTGTVNRTTGFGNFYPKHGETVGAHRYSYELANGPVPEGLDVHQRCGRRDCVRPAHLQALTRAQVLSLRVKPEDE